MTKIDIISGFLGAGKTTFIKKMLQDAFAGEQVVLIENEFGEIGIDGGFLKDSGIEIREMNSGCICCSLVGDFGKSMKEVVGTYHPDRILIEPSGVGKLSDVMKAVQDVQGEIDAELNSFTTVVDAMKCRLYRNNFGEFFSNQVEYAGAVILSRTDKADLEKVRESCQIIRELNKRAPIITTPIMELTGEKLLETMEQGKSLEEELLADMMRPGYGEQHGHGKACGCRHEHDADGEAGQPHGEHGEDCGCGGKHHDGDHGEERGCGGKHHDGGHGEDCGCGGKHHDGGHGEDCGCGGKHHDGNHEGHVHGEGCGCRHGHHGDGHEGQGQHGHSQDHGHHHAEEVFTSWGCETVKVFTKEEINQILDSLESDESYGTVLRAKGMVEGDGGWIYFDMVPKEHEVRSGAAEYTGRICVIGSDLKEDMLETLFGVK